MPENFYRIAVIPGDGIGKEVVPAAQGLLDTVAAGFDFEIQWTVFDWSCELYASTGSMTGGGTVAELADFDAIFLGAVGYPGVADHVSLWGLLIPIRRQFSQYVNLRPVRLWPGVRTPLVDRVPAEIDFVIVRENNEGEYSEIGGRLYEGTANELAVQQSVFTRDGVDRVLRYAFELALSRPGRHLTSATKSNGIIHTMPFWDERFERMAAEYPEVKTDQYHIDILAAHLVQHPDWFDVIVASNLFGDILSDLGPAVAGSIGLAPGANLNPDLSKPSMFEPVHGSAPDIAGQGIANPVAQILTGAMMLDHLKQPLAAEAIDSAVKRVLQEQKIKPNDLGGSATTVEMADAIAAALR